MLKGFDYWMQINEIAISASTYKPVRDPGWDNLLLRSQCLFDPKVKNKLELLGLHDTFLGICFQAIDLYIDSDTVYDTKANCVSTPRQLHAIAKSMPDIPGIYIISHGKPIDHRVSEYIYYPLYVGYSENLRGRWKGHKIKQKITDLYYGDFIQSHIILDPLGFKTFQSMEKYLIKVLRPELNQLIHHTETKSSVLPKPTKSFPLTKKEAQSLLNGILQGKQSDIVKGKQIMSVLKSRQESGFDMVLNQLFSYIEGNKKDVAKACVHSAMWEAFLDSYPVG